MSGISQKWWVISGLLVVFSSSLYAETEIITYEYDNLNRLEKAESGSGVQQTFSFDEKHNRLTLDKQAISPDAPTANNDSYNVSQGTLLNPTSNGVLANDTDPNDQSISAINYSQPEHGSLTANADGSFTYEPEEGFSGTDSFVYQVSNGVQNGNFAVVTITVLSLNPPPVVNVVDYEVVEDSTTRFDVLSNSNDPNGDDLTIISVEYSGDGQVSTDGQTISYTPASDFVGSETITYTISDGVNEVTKTLTVTVTGENDAPIARTDRVAVTYGKNATILVLANDSDPEGGDLTITGISYSGSGTVSHDGTAITYSLASGATSDQFTYIIEDEEGLSSTGYVFINLVSNVAPIARNDSEQVLEDNSKVFHILSNDEDPNGDALTIVSTSNPAHGSVSILQGNEVIYTPSRNYVGGDSFSYTIQDTQGLSATATVFINVSANNTNSRPVAGNDFARTKRNTPVTISFLSNDTDPDLDGLIYVSHTAPTRGTVTRSGNTFRYTPPTNFEGRATFRYTIRDAGGLTSSATVEINVTDRVDITPIIMLLLDDDCTVGQVLDPETNECVEGGQ